MEVEAGFRQTQGQSALAGGNVEEPPAREAAENLDYRVVGRRAGEHSGLLPGSGVMTLSRHRRTGIAIWCGGQPFAPCWCGSNLLILCAICISCQAEVTLFRVRFLEFRSDFQPLLSAQSKFPFGSSGINLSAGLLLERERFLFRD